MNINEAFRLRNRLKDRIKDLKERVTNAEYEKTENTEEFTRCLLCTAKICKIGMKLF